MAMKPRLPRVTTVKDLSDYLRADPSTVDNLLLRGELPAFGSAPIGVSTPRS